MTNAKVLTTFTLLPIVFYAASSITGIKQIVPFVVLAAILLLVLERMVLHLKTFGRTVLWLTLVLSLMGSTGWFFSVFFFAVHLSAIAIGFLYSPKAAVFFVSALILTFLTGVGEVNVTSDLLVLLSILSAIPITIALRRGFLVVQQAEKGILILEGDEKKSGVTTLDNILANRINHVSVLLRQPITYLRQSINMFKAGKLSANEQADVMNRMEQSAEELSTLVKEFESGTTKNMLIDRHPVKPEESA